MLEPSSQVVRIALGEGEMEEIRELAARAGLSAPKLLAEAWRRHQPKIERRLAKQATTRKSGNR